MAVKTLNDFLGNYLRTKKIDLGDEGFAKWMTKNGLDPDGTLDKKLTAAQSGFARSLPGYGTNAERLAKSGLTKSGYADYLSANAYSQMRKEKVDALKDYADEMKKNAAGYADYLTGKAEKDATLYRTVVGQIGKSNILDSDEAYDFAIRAGLDEENAKSAAKKGVTEAKDKLRSKLAGAMLSGNLTKERALRFANFFGLDDDDVEWIRSIFKEEPEEYYPSEGPEFLEYLKRQMEKG